MISNFYLFIFFTFFLVNQISSREYSLDDLFSNIVEETTKTYEENNNSTIEKSKTTAEESVITKFHATAKNDETTESYSVHLHPKITNEEETSEEPQLTSEEIYEIVIYDEQITTENEATTKNPQISLYSLNLHQESSESSTESEIWYISEESDERNSNEIIYDNSRRESKKHQLAPKTCEDYSDSCEKLSICENEEIRIEFKRLYCAETCGFCSSNHNCRDIFESCGRWKSKGYCKKSEIRTTACAKTCGICL